MSVTNLSKSNFQAEVLEKEGITLIDFWASWCGPCRMLSPLVDEVAEEVDTAKVCKVNVDEQQELARQFNIMSIPTLVVLKDGKEVKRSLGFVPKEDIKKLIGA